MMSGQMFNTVVSGEMPVTPGSYWGCAEEDQVFSELQ